MDLFRKSFSFAQEETYKSDSAQKWEHAGLMNEAPDPSLLSVTDKTFNRDQEEYC